MSLALQLQEYIDGLGLILTPPELRLSKKAGMAVRKLLPIAEIGRLMAHRLQAHGGFTVFSGHDPAEVAQAHLLRAEGCGSSVLEDVLQNAPCPKRQYDSIRRMPSFCQIVHHNLKSALEKLSRATVQSRFNHAKARQNWNEKTSLVYPTISWGTAESNRF
eukprot:4081669-Amphidinium_carterae.1